MQVEQRKRLQFLHGGRLVAYAHQIADALLRHIACRHGEILSGQQPLDGIHRQDPAHIRLLVSGISGVLKGFLRFLQLPLSFRKLLLGALKLPLGRLQRLLPGCKLRLNACRYGHSTGKGLHSFLKGLPAFLKLLPACLELLFPFLKSFPGGSKPGRRILHLLVDGCVYQPVDRIDLLLADDHVDALLQKPRRADACHPFNALQIRHNGIPDICADLAVIHPLYTHSRNHDRQHIRIQLHNNGISHGIIPEALYLIQALPDLQRNRVHIRGLREFHYDHGIILAGYGVYVFNIADRCHGRLHRLGHNALHRLGAGPRIGCHHNHIGQTDAWQQIRRHPCKGNHAQNDRQHHPYQHCIRLFYTEFRNHVYTLLRASAHITFSVRPVGRRIHMDDYITRVSKKSI